MSHCFASMTELMHFCLRKVSCVGPWTNGAIIKHLSVLQFGETFVSLCYLITSDKYHIHFHIQNHTGTNQLYVIVEMNYTPNGIRKKDHNLFSLLILC